MIENPCSMVYKENRKQMPGGVMQTTNDFLDMLKARRGLESDYALAKFLGCGQSRISNYRNKRSFLADEEAILMSEMLEIDPAIILAAVHFERAKKAQEKAVWKGIFDRLGGLAASVLLGVALLGSLHDTASAQGDFFSRPVYTLCELVENTN